MLPAITDAVKRSIGVGNRWQQDWTQVPMGGYAGSTWGGSGTGSVMFSTSTSPAIYASAAEVLGGAA